MSVSTAESITTEQTRREAQIENKIAALDNPHRDEEVLDFLYWGKKMSTREVGDKLDASHKTICTWLDKTGVGARTNSEANIIQRASYYTTKNGYEQWTSNNSDGSVDQVYVHQLASIAWGEDPEDVFGEGANVHHRSKFPSLNIEGGLEVLSDSEHTSLHNNEEWTEEDGIPVLVNNTEEAE